MLQSFTLNNGLKVATYSQPHLNAIYMTIAVRAGTLYENESNFKVGHLTEHLMRYGIPALPTFNSYKDFFLNASSYRRLFTDTDQIYMDLDFPKEYLENILKVTSQTFFEPLLPKEAIELEKKTVINENDKRFENLTFFNARYINPGYFTKLLMSQVKDHYYDKVTREDVIKYWSTFFIPNNAFLVIVGDFGDSDIKVLIERCLGKYSNNKTPPIYPAFSNNVFTNKGVKLISERAKTCSVNLTFPSAPLNINLKEFIISKIVEKMLRSSLMQNLYEYKGYVYEVGFIPIRLPNFGEEQIHTVCRAQNLKDLVDTMLTIIQNFKTHGHLNNNLDFEKKLHVNRILIEDDNPIKLCSRLKDELMYQQPVTMQEYKNLTDQITAESIADYVNKYWDFSKALLFIRGPFDQMKFLSDVNEEGLMQLLNKLN